MERHERRQSDGELQRHQEDLFAHPRLENRLRLEDAATRIDRYREVDALLSAHGARLSRLERFQWLLTGVGLALTAGLSAGALTWLLHR